MKFKEFQKAIKLYREYQKKQVVTTVFYLDHNDIIKKAVMPIYPELYKYLILLATVDGILGLDDTIYIEKEW